jgi:hypothetical protein
MLSKCANPSCSASFRYFHQGKLFRMETSLTADATNGSAGNANAGKPAARVEYFWLCDLCAPQMTLQYDSRGHVTVTPVVHGYREAS